MAVEHMVWIRFHQDVRPERIDEHMRRLAGMRGKIDVIQALHVGPSFTDRAAGFTHGLRVTLPDRPALQAYLEHPDHVAVAKPLKEDAEVWALDIGT